MQFGSTGVVLVVLARAFPPNILGRYVGALAAVLFLAPLASLGAGDLLLKRHSGQGHSIASATALARGMAVAGGVAATALLMLARPLILPSVAPGMLLSLAVAELLGAGIVDVAQTTMQARERLQLVTLMRFFQGGFRLLGAFVLFFFLDNPAIETWAYVYLAASLLSALTSSTIADRASGGSETVRAPSLSEASEGLGLVLGWGTDRLRSDADKFLLFRLGRSADAGVYGAAYRLLEIALVPIRALVVASMASFWRDSQEPGGGARLARRLSVPTAIYGVVAMVAIWLGAPLVTIALGSAYHESIDVLRWLAPVPLILGMQAFPATALTTEGYLRPRVVLVVAAAAFNIALNIFLIPRFGWKGAAAATLVTEVALASGYWIVLLRVMRQSRGFSAVGSPAR